GDVVAMIAECRVRFDDRDRGLDAGHFLGGRDVDRFDLGVGVGAVEHDAEQRPFRPDVGWVLGPTRRFQEAVDAGDSGADQASGFWPTCHGFTLLSWLWPRRAPLA